LLANTRECPSERIHVLGSTALLALLVGMSRVALGVHWATDGLGGWATDGLGGWAFGSAWAIGWLLCARLLSAPSTGMHAARPPRGSVCPGPARRQIEASRPAIVSTSADVQRTRLEKDSP